MEVRIDNILDMISSYGEEGVREDLDSFSSPQNQEIEDFIRNKSIEFAQRKLSVSYIVSDASDGEILGYFTLAHKALDIKGTNLSNTNRRKLGNYARYDQDEDNYSVSAFLLAQFGKNYAVDEGKRISGTELMEYAIDILSDIQHRIGGGGVYLDAEDRPKLTEFYEDKVKYKCFGERYSEADQVKYLQYMRFF